MSSDKVVPVVGMGVTMGIGSDAYPYTVIQVVSEKRCIVQADKKKRTDSNGQSEDQRYLFVPDSMGEKIEIYLSTRGDWRKRGNGGKSSYRFTLGKRSAYTDPSF